MQKVSIISMTYNDLEHLKKCTAHVLEQDYENIEYIIVDGDSKDGTKEFLASLQTEHPDKVIFISEPDRGLYDALNKGIQLATGDIIGIMNDCFTKNSAISQMVEIIEREGSDGVHADIHYVDEHGRVVRRWKMGRGSIRTGWQVGHPTLYLKKEIFEKYGLYKINFKIAADYEFMIRILKDGNVKLSYIPEVLVEMFHGENSTSTGGVKNYIESFKDGHRALVENQIPFPLFTDVCRIFRFVKQFFASGLDKN